ncbi:MAG TPA: hypothetical protein VGE20_16305 [Ramlibacter sp.]
MKMAAFLAAAALACGSAMAADSKTEHGQRVSNEHPAKASGDGVVDKTKRAFSRMGDKIRNTGERLGQKLGTDKDSRDDTRAMGASGSDEAQDQGRRQRMDDAYANWRGKQQQERR